WVALAQYRYHNAHAGKFALDAIARTGFDESRGRNPEVISGRVYKPLDSSVPHQFFATSMVLTPLLRGLLGLDVDAPARMMTFAPHLPPEWDSLRVENVPVGEDRLAITLKRELGRITAAVSRTGRSVAAGGSMEFVFSPALPLGARVTGDAVAERTPGDVHGSVRGKLSDTSVYEVTYAGGWSVIPATRAPRIGDRSSALRVLSERLESEVYVVSLEGLAGRSYELRVRGPEAFSVLDTVDVTAGPSAHSPPHVGYRTLNVTFPRAGENSDGYVKRVLRFTSRSRGGK
ncbi:MAG: hypothetical protein ABR543_14420, partial [Gemmatimonadaceae bacterium]